MPNGEEGVSPAVAFTGRLSDPADMSVIACLGAARNRRLYIYAGAGISRSSGLPNGKELAERLHARFTALGVNLDGVVATDLLAVADALAARPDGLEALQNECLAAADFTEAAPAPAHVALALLLLEDAIELLSTNWDTCIERAAPEGEQILAVVSNEDARQISGKALLKLHGCARRRATILVTTEQLKQPLVWSDTATAAALSQATVVFIGIGDVAPYAQLRLEQVLAHMTAIDHVAVVSPGIISGWDKSQWKKLLGEAFPDNRRWAMTADEFAARLVCAWVNSALEECRQAADTVGVAALPRTFADFRRVLMNERGVDVLRWMRRAAVAAQPGRSVAWDGSLCEALLALSLMVDANELKRVPLRGPWRSGPDAFDVVVAVPRADAAKVADEAYRRAEQYRVEGLLGPDEPLTVVCSGQYSGLTRQARLPADVVASSEDGDVIGGGAVHLVDAHLHLEEAA